MSLNNRVAYFVIFSHKPKEVKSKLSTIARETEQRVIPRLVKYPEGKLSCTNRTPLALHAKLYKEAVF